MAREVTFVARDRKSDRNPNSSNRPSGRLGDHRHGAHEAHHAGRHGDRERVSLESIEQGLGKVIERPFSRLFRSPLQPAEIERACVREIEKSRRLGVSTVYVANVYYVVISPKDEDNLGDLIRTLERDLSTRLFAYAANNRYEMVTRPVVTFMVDDDFKLGDLLVYGEHMGEDDVEREFGIVSGPHAFEFDSSRKQEPAARPAPVASPAVTPPAAAAAPMPADTPAHAPEPWPTPAASPTNAPSWEPLVSTAAESSPPTSPTPWDDGTKNPGGPVPVTTPVPGRLVAGIAVSGRPPLALHRGMRYTIGRQEGCDIVIVDPQVSRVHATIEGDAKGWYITDRGSTNGTLVNRVAITTQKLRNGDTIRIGDVDITYGESWVDDKSAL